MMHYSDGSAFAWDFGIDGKEYKTAEGRTTTWTANSATEWTSITKLNGTVLSTNHYTLSPDGKTLSITYAGTKPDGSKFNDSATYTRVTGMPTSSPPQKRAALRRRSIPSRSRQGCCRDFVCPLSR